MKPLVPLSAHTLRAEPGGLAARRPHQSTAALLWALRAPVRVRADTLKFTVKGNIAAAKLPLETDRQSGSGGHCTSVPNTIRMAPCAPPFGSAGSKVPPLLDLPDLVPPLRVPPPSAFRSPRGPAVVLIGPCSPPVVSVSVRLRLPRPPYLAGNPENKR